MNINAPAAGGQWQTRLAHHTLNTVLNPDTYKITAIAIFTLFGCLSVASTVLFKQVADDRQSSSYERNEFTYDCVAEYCPDYHFHEVANIVTSVAALLFVFANGALAYSMRAPKKIAKIAIPLIVGSGMAATIGLSMPEECSKITGLYPPYVYQRARDCRWLLFNKNDSARYFPNCTVAYTINLAGSYFPGGLCTNTTIELTQTGLWQPWVYNSSFPSIIATDLRPGVCIIDHYYNPSVTDPWDTPDSNLNFNALNYWKNIDKNFYLPANITSTKNLFTKHSDGSWEGTIKNTGWIMTFNSYPKDLCVKVYADLPQEVLDCGSEAFKEEYINTFDPMIINFHEKEAQWNETIHLCKPWIGYLLYSYPADLILAGFAGIVACCSIRCTRRRPIEAQHLLPHHVVQPAPAPPQPPGPPLPRIEEVIAVR